MRAFDDLTDEPCLVCLAFAARGEIQGRAVMPLPTFPALLRLDGEPCCRDCQATDTTQAMGFQHPMFGPARLTIANERCEGLTMPIGMMEHFGLCRDHWILPCSNEDLESHHEWLGRHGIPDSASAKRFEPSIKPFEGETQS